MIEKMVDLHNHTKFSDGSLSPAKLIEVAKEKGIAAMGITDHDTMEGITPAQKAGEEHDIEIVPGLELSTHRGGKEFHLLGYYCDPKHPLLKTLLDKMISDRQDRMKKMITRLGDLGLTIDITEILSKTEGRAPGRPHLALTLCQKGYCRTPLEAFQKYIGNGCPPYVERYKLDLYKAIDLVRIAGGIPVLAHPGIYKEDHFIPSMVKKGLLGIEVFHPDHRPKDVNKYQQLAQKYDLLITGGSDYHGEGIGSAPVVGTITIGYKYLEELKNMIQKQEVF